ncbi:hypothetical protein D1007_54909 [Hordeum vulgare]|uniref:Predicted protein n=1 Tax=Hordeum vulgare subsp. vulgare TaxID=112509 RepID=F2E423_HORVV|nr:uncharacterized protein LOC123401480 [Hordeum vulgare subsp. vulgare]KAE8773001.1 hypothetical protein D1007_54909 [Hordeum vulgare]KAI4979468.1 hypothetical protein ZWY2020_016221 [Hordeum vulgare]BAK02095.1 predicted protein [Hordeum vulgare subsp. vulgare]
MVLWEITAITAYFLGLRRTYRLALRGQRRLIGPNHPKLRDFVYRRTRSIFDVAVSVHKNIQERDLEVGRNVGNAVLRWLDRMKPSAQIRPHPPGPPGGSPEQLRHLSTMNKTAGAQKPASKTSTHDSSGKMLFSPLNIRPKSFPILPTMMQSTRISASSQCRRLSTSPFPSVTARRKDMMEGVFRKDIAQLMV